VVGLFHHCGIWSLHSNYWWLVYFTTVESGHFPSKVGLTN